MILYMSKQSLDVMLFGYFPFSPFSYPSWSLGTRTTQELGNERKVYF
jgi:hypothetical protein